MPAPPSKRLFCTVNVSAAGHRRGRVAIGAVKGPASRPLNVPTGIGPGFEDSDSIRAARRCIGGAGKGTEFLFRNLELVSSMLKAWWRLPFG